MNDTNCLFSPTEKQLRMITALLWKLRPFYLFPQWQEITGKLQLLLEDATKKIASSVIQRMLTVLEEKQKTNAKKVWIPMDYHLENPVWQKNIVKMAPLGVLALVPFPKEKAQRGSFLFPDKAESFETLDPNDMQAWRELKNRIEREESRRSHEMVDDEFENDTRFAQEEEIRWKRGKRDYFELIQGIDFLDPISGIDC